MSPRRLGVLLAALTFFAVVAVPGVAHAEYETATNIAPSAVNARQMAMSGSRVVWIDDRTGTPQVYLYDLETHAEQQLTSGGMDKRNPDIVNDRIVYLLETTVHPKMFDPRHAYNAMYVDTRLGTSGTLSSGDCNEVRIIGDVAYWRELMSSFYGFGSRNLLTGEFHGASYTGTVFPLLDPSNGRNAGSWDYQGYAGYNVGTGTFGVWVSKKSEFVGDSIHTTPSVTPGLYKAPLTVTMTSAPGATTYYRVNGGSALQYTGPVTFSDPGTMTLSYWSQDGGNVEHEHAMDLELVSGPSARAWVKRAYTYDTHGFGTITLPGVPAVTPDDGWIYIYSLSNSTYLEFESTGTAGSFTNVIVDGGSVQRFEGGGSIWIAMSNEGSHRVDWWGSDAYGREATQTGYVNFDKWAPSTSCSVDPGGWTNGTPQVITFSATDTASGVGTTYWRIDPWGSGIAYTDGTPNVYSTPVTITAPGRTTVEYWTVDRVGHEESHKYVDVGIDVDFPTTRLNGLTDGEMLRDPMFYLERSDPTTWISRTWFRINGGPVQTWDPLVYWYSAATGGDGLKIIEYGSVDAVGNAETTKSITVNVDRTPPTVTTNIPPNWPYDSETATYTPYLVQIDAVDAGSGVQSIHYQVQQRGQVWGPDTVYTGPFWVKGPAQVNYYAIDNLGNRTATVLYPLAFGIDHETTYPGFGKCQGSGCHVTNLVSIHANQCRYCHLGPGKGVIVRNKSCDGCHTFDGAMAPPIPDHTWDQAHYRGTLDARCAACHTGSGLAGEHVYVRNVSCEKCHDSTNSGSLLPGSARAIVFGQMKCSDCHTSYHGVKMGASMPASVTLDPAYKWTAPLEGVVYESESWYPADAVGKRAKIVLSDRRQVSSGMAWSTFCTSMTQLGWTVSGNAPDSTAEHFTGVLACGSRRAAMVFSSGRGHTDPTVPGLGSRIELIWWDTQQ